MDDLFKAHFSNSEAPVTDAEGLWTAIETARQPKKKRPIMWWTFGASIAVAILLMGIYFSFFNKNLNGEIAAIAPVIEEHIEGNTETNKMTEATDNQPISTINTVNNFKNKETNTTANHQSSRTENDVEKVANIAISSKKSAQTIAHINGGVLSILSEDIPLQNVQKAATLTIEKINTTINNSNNNKALNRLPILNLNPLKTPTPTNENTSPILQNKALNQPIANTIANQKKTPNTDINTDKKAKNDKRDWDKCTTNDCGNFFVKAYGQAALPFEEIRTQEPNTYITYSNNWENEIAPFSSFGGGLQVGYTFPWQGHISAGLSYQHYQTKYEATRQVVEQITIIDDMAFYYIDDNGETIWVADTITTTESYEITEIKANNHQLWHIPIQFGYIATHNKLRFGGNVEALINISKQYEGYFITEENSTLAINSATDEGYMSSSIGVSISGGLHLGYVFGEHLEVYLSPRFRWNGGSYLHENQPLHIATNFAGLRMGLGYHF